MYWNGDGEFFFFICHNAVSVLCFSFIDSWVSGGLRQTQEVKIIKDLLKETKIIVKLYGDSMHQKKRK
jgi:hypothetical protein